MRAYRSGCNQRISKGRGVALEIGEINENQSGESSNGESYSRMNRMSTSVELTKPYATENSPTNAGFLVTIAVKASWMVGANAWTDERMVEPSVSETAPVACDTQIRKCLSTRPRNRNAYSNISGRCLERCNKSGCAGMDVLIEYVRVFSNTSYSVVSPEQRQEFRQSMGTH